MSQSTPMPAYKRKGLHRIEVDLPEGTWKKLEEKAKAEFRFTNQQAAFYISKSLEEK
ncbi:MAG: hypothetical protein KGI38_12120 [Thaumarchaeota archaeon]|nr:hypothetical protein [Nitrososphaerota archaeon]